MGGLPERVDAVDPLEQPLEDPLDPVEAVVDGAHGGHLRARERLGGEPFGQVAELG